MATTTPDSIYYPTANDQIAPLETVFSTMASSMQAALTNTRAKFYYRWGNAASRAAQTGMRVGDEGFQTDTGFSYRYDGTAWQIWGLARRSYSPSLSTSGFNLGSSGGSEMYVSIRGGYCRIDFRMRFSGTGVSWGDIRYPVPYTPTGLLASTPGMFGTALVNDSDGGTYFVATGLVGDGTWRVYRTGTSNGSSATWASSQPFNPATGDSITGFIEYPTGG